MAMGEQMRAGSDNRGVFVAAAIVALWAPLSASAAEPRPDDGALDQKQIQTAIDAGLGWLAAQQIKEGSEAGTWECTRYRTATASLASLAFLANGHLPGKGEYGPVIDRAMRYVQASMTPDGYLGGRDGSMYVHAIATLFGLSYLGMCEDSEREMELAEWCRKSIDLIVRAQKVRKPRWDQGGWRYTPDAKVSDLSVTSWQLLVLHAARQCGYEIDDAVFDDALRYVNRTFLEAEDGQAGFRYTIETTKSPEPAVTGVAVFVKSLLERQPDEKIAKALKYLKGFPPSWGGPQYKGYFFFGTFYMVQGMFQIGGDTWAEFAPKIYRVLIEHQQGDGHWDFPPDNKPQSHPAGLAYTTATSVLILSLEKQYLPMYLRQKQLF